MKSLILAAALLTAGAANAVTYTSSPGNPDPGPGAGETVVFDFNSPTPELTGSYSLLTGTNGDAAAPAGDATQYAAVPVAGPGSPVSGTASLDLSGLARPIKTLSLYWGSVDTYNTLRLFSGGTLVYTLNGAALPPANGNQDASITNRRVFFNVANDNIDRLEFSSDSKAFEFDDIAVSSVPEPSSWAMLIAGFGLIGFAARQRRNIKRVAS